MIVKKATVDAVWRARGAVAASYCDIRNTVCVRRCRTVLKSTRYTILAATVSQQADLALYCSTSGPDTFSYLGRLLSNGRSLLFAETYFIVVLYPVAVSAGA